MKTAASEWLCGVGFTADAQQLIESLKAMPRKPMKRAPERPTRVATWTSTCADPYGRPRMVFRMQWKPSEPVVVAGYTLSRDECWVRAFTQEIFRLSGGSADLDTAADCAIVLLPTKGNQDPVEVARAAWLEAS